MSDLIEMNDLPSLIAEAAAASKLDLAAGSYRLAVMAGTCVIDEQRGAARVESIAAEWARFSDLKALSLGALSLKDVAPPLELNTDGEVRLP